MIDATRRNDFDSVNADKSVKEASVEALSSIDTTVIPGAILLLAYLAPYSAMVSFTLRGNSQARLLPVGCAYFLGAFLGGVFFPRLLSWVNLTGSSLRRAALGVYLVAALAAVLPGFHHYIFNEQLRFVANLLLGMMIAPAYHIFFSRFPVRWRGSWFGASLGMGLFC